MFLCCLDYKVLLLYITTITLYKQVYYYFNKCSLKWALSSISFLWYTYFTCGVICQLSITIQLYIILFFPVPFYIATTFSRCSMQQQLVYYNYLVQVFYENTYTNYTCISVVFHVQYYIMLVITRYLQLVNFNAKPHLFYNKLNNFTYL